MPTTTGTKVWTYILTNGTITLTSDDNINIIALNWLSGTVTVTGGMSVQGLGPTAVSINTSNPNLTVGGASYQIDKLIINAAAGSVQIIAYT